MIVVIADADTSGFLGVLIGLGVLLVGGAWLVFPFIMMSKIDHVHRAMKELLETTKRIEQWHAREDSHLSAIRRYYEEPKI